MVGTKQMKDLGGALDREDSPVQCSPENLGAAWRVGSVKDIPQSTDKNLQPSLLLLLTAQIENTTT